MSNQFGQDGDDRYKEPKKAPKATEEAITKAINTNAIYREVSERIERASFDRCKETIHSFQRKQVGYGLDKYPETLNKDSWTSVETIDHIIEESIDKLHYLVMLRQKLIDKQK